MHDEREIIYKVIMNHDEHLAYIKEVWTDMRPLSLRKKMQEMGYE